MRYATGHQQKDRARIFAKIRRCRAVLENGSEESLLLVRAEPLEWAEEISQRMVNEVRIVDGTLLLDADSAWAGATKTVLVMKGVRVSKLSAGSQRTAA